MIFKNTILSNTDVFNTGSYYQGGFVVWANLSTNQGLIVSTTDLSGSQCAWQNEPYESVTTSEAYGQGQTNTTNILASTSPTPAAELCDAYSNDGYTDWFLPSTTEMLYVFNAYRDGFLRNASIRPSPYWTSYAPNFASARFVDFAIPSSYTGQVGDGFRCCGPSSPGPGLWVRACRYITFT